MTERGLAAARVGATMSEIEHTAGRLAAAQPESTMPCRLYAATVNGATLARQLGKVHP